MNKEILFIPFNRMNKTAFFFIYLSPPTVIVIKTGAWILDLKLFPPWLIQRILQYGFYYSKKQLEKHGFKLRKGSNSRRTVIDVQDKDLFH